MQTTDIHARVVFERHADFHRHAAEARRARRPARKRQRMAIVSGARYFADRGSSQRGELHRARA